MDIFPLKTGSFFQSYLFWWQKVIGNVQWTMFDIYTTNTMWTSNQIDSWRHSVEIISSKTPECFQSHFFNLVTKVFHELTHSTSQVWLGIYLANNKFARFISTFLYSLFNELMISENFFVHAVFCVLTLMPFERNMCQDVTLS